MSIISESLQYKLLSALKIDDFWVQFLEAVSVEIENMREQIATTKDLFNVDEQLEDGLLDIANTFGYTPNLIVDNSLSMVRKETESIPIRIRNKTTYDGYYMIFKQIGMKGEIYNFYWSGDKLIRAIKYAKTLDNLNSGIDFTEPFIKTVADKNFSTISLASPINLDNGSVLDVRNGQFYWQLDENIQITPTQHLGIEYYITEPVNDNYLITSEYFQYLATGVEYTRRTPIIPHVGIQLTGIMRENSGYNFFNTSNSYSIPALKLNCSTVFQYNKRFTVLDKFYLDSSEGKGLDELISWNLDAESSVEERLSLSSIKYISCGTGSLALPDESNKNIFDYSKMVIFYTFSDLDNSYVVTDYSVNAHNATITGNTKKIKGIIGRTINFDGSTYLKTDATISIPVDNLSFCFWLKPNASEYYSSSDTKYIADFNFLKIWYVYSESKLYYTMKTLSGSCTINHDTIYNIIFEFNNTDKKLYVYVSGTLADTQDISSIDYSGEYSLTVGADSSANNKFIGLLDSMSLMNKIFTSDEKSYIVNNKLGLATHLSDKLATYTIDPNHEAYSSDYWYYIQSHVKANDITDEFAFFVSSDVTVYTGNTNFYPIKNKYFSFTYKIANGANQESVEIKANADGNFYNASTNEDISGSIDYDTGVYTIYSYTNRYITQEVVSKTGAVAGTAFTVYIKHQDIKTSSFKLKYIINNYDYVAKDNGEGIVTGTYVTGTINYVSGELNLTFTTLPDSDILAFYTYKNSLNMIADSDVTFNYKTDNSVNISEIGLENANHELIAYMTFPPIQFYDTNNHVSASFAIRKMA